MSLFVVTQAVNNKHNSSVNHFREKVRLNGWLFLSCDLCIKMRDILALKTYYIKAIYMPKVVVSNVSDSINNLCLASNID